LRLLQIDREPASSRCRTASVIGDLQLNQISRQVEFATLTVTFGPNWRLRTTMIFPDRSTRWPRAIS
jgi:hypothetical protein